MKNFEDMTKEELIKALEEKNALVADYELKELNWKEENNILQKRLKEAEEKNGKLVERANYLVKRVDEADYKIFKTNEANKEIGKQLIQLLYIVYGASEESLNMELDNIKGEKVD